MVKVLPLLLFEVTDLIEESFVQVGPLVGETGLNEEHLGDLLTRHHSNGLELLPSDYLQLVCEFFELAEHVHQKVVDDVDDLLPHFLDKGLRGADLALNPLLDLNSEDFGVEEVGRIYSLIFNNLLS